MERLAELAFAAFVVLLAAVLVGLLLGEFGFAADVALTVMGAAFLAGSAFGAVEALQRVHQLLRFPFTAVRTPGDLDALAPGTHWVRVEAAMSARGDPVSGVLAAAPAAAVTVEGSERERFARLPRPTTGNRGFDRTAVAPAALHRPGTDPAPADPRFEGDDVRVVGGETARLTVDDDLPRHTRESLEGLGVDPESDISRGHVFEHYVRVSEATVPDGATARLFGRVRVERGGTTTLSPAGRFEARPLLTAGGPRAILRRVAGRLGVLLGLVPLTGAGGLLLLAFVFGLG